MQLKRAFTIAAAAIALFALRALLLARAAHAQVVDFNTTHSVFYEAPTRTHMLVYTPGGNWSSYPPHKHDVHNPPAEVDLDEIYYYRMNRPGAFAHQRLYNTDGSRDSVVTARDGDVVLVRSDVPLVGLRR